MVQQHPHPLPLSSRLRSATAEVHHRLETALDLLRPDFTLAHYVPLLRAFHGFLRPWEAQLAACGAQADADDLAQRRHVPRLEADLAHFGERPGELPAAAALPALRSAGAVLGSRYVIEGSTLGGRVIVAHLQQRLPVTAQAGARYFAGYGARTGEMWKRFGRQLDAAPAAEHDAAVAGALDTFETLHAWLRRCGVLR